MQLIVFHRECHVDLLQSPKYSWVCLLAPAASCSSLAQCALHVQLACTDNGQKSCHWVKSSKGSIGYTRTSFINAGIKFACIHKSMTCPLSSREGFNPWYSHGGLDGTILFSKLFPWTQSHMECPHGSQVCQFFVWVNPHAWIVFITWRSVICTQMCTFHSLNWRWTLLLFRPTRSNQKNRARICIQVLSALPRGRYISRLFRHDKNLCRRIKWEDKNVMLLIAVVWMRVPSHRFSSQVSSD